MADVLSRHKPLSVNPLKSSQTMGAALALLGLHRAMPLLHGSQGCTAFAKVFFVRHFREPIPLQTTAMDQVSSIMGANDNVLEGLVTVCEKAKPEVVGILTTGLSETQGVDIHRVLREWRQQYPRYHNIHALAVNTPDFQGCLETGFAECVRAMIDAWVPASAHTVCTASTSRQINVLAGSLLTPGDLEALKELIEGFGLEPLILPDLSDSLDGHLTDTEFSPITVGGTPVAALSRLHHAAATFVIGASLKNAADLLRERTGVTDYRFDHLLGLQATDRLIMALRSISGHPVPSRIERQRAQLLDTMLDTHFILGQARVAVALDADLLSGFSALLTEMGMDIVAAVASHRAPILGCLPMTQVQIGDLADLEQQARSQQADLLISNSHATSCAERLNIPLLRAGFPQYDWFGGYQRVTIGYRGMRQLLFDLANLVHHHPRHAIAPYAARYSRKTDPVC